jgi:KipI family sensor histidine kinase inhibitor
VGFGCAEAMRRRPYGPCAWLVVEVDAPAAWASALSRMDVSGVIEIVPAESTVVVRCERTRHDEVGAILDTVVHAESTGDPGPPLTIDVVYDGPDLAELARTARLDVEDVVHLHSSGVYQVAFCGFSPGFGYLRGVDTRLHVPRRDTPRTSVPAGSIGVAAGYTCVYPAASPGGWHLVGRTTTSLWDVERDPPALLRPGRTVRFRSVTP